MGEAFQREHPHLPVAILLDGLFANAPMIKLLKQHHMHDIIVCQETNHTWLTDWVARAEAPDINTLVHPTPQGTRTYSWMGNVPLNASQKGCETGVFRYEEVHDWQTQNQNEAQSMDVDHRSSLSQRRFLSYGGRSRIYNA